MTESERSEQYLDQLGLEPSARAALASALERSEPGRQFADLHAWLAGTAAASPASQLDSVEARIRRLDSAIPLERDQQGNIRLVTTPPMHRSKMLPEPLGGNPAARLWRRLRLRLGLQPPTPVALAKRRHTVSSDATESWRYVALRRRLTLLALALAQSVGATWLMSAVLPYHGQHPLELAVLAIYAILFFWISAGFWTALSGFWLLLRGRDRYSVSSGAGRDTAIPQDARTAIIIPICNEDVNRVFAGLRATYTSLARTGNLAQFDFFILSDSSNPDIRVAELVAWQDCCRRLDGFGHIFYRRRTHRIKRKSGNVADFCRRWGAAYRYMVVLDADSVMSGACLVRLVQLMEAHPNAGIIQTAPLASGRETLYGRIQQFAHRVYGPLFTAGLHFWQLGESHYWGHNAILRVAPFIRHCALPRLSGTGAMSGEIMSHDFVEAALMRRAGWAVWIAYDLPGSYEEMPPTLLDELSRDRRWCLGNLQNFRLFLAQGLHPAHRAVFMTGVMAYLSSPLWFLFLLLSTALLAVHTLIPPTYFTQPEQLFPIWPEWHPEWAVQLFVATAALLLLPKLLAALLLQLRHRQSRPYGGVLKVAFSVLLEIVFSALLAPIRMLFHTQYVVTALLGLSSGWKSPPREDAETHWLEALRRHGGGTVLGCVWAAFVVWLNPIFLWWLLPIVGSLVAAIPLSVWSSRRRLGNGCREQRLFLIPEESVPPRELRTLELGMLRHKLPRADFRTAALEPRINALVCAAGRSRMRLSRHAESDRRHLLQRALKQGPGGLTEHERARLLNDPRSLAELHGALWTASTLPPAWNDAPLG